MSNRAASRLVLEPFTEETATRVARELLREVGGKVTCAFVFVSSEYQAQLPDFLELIQLHGHVPTLIGCSGAGLLGTGVEALPAMGFSLLFLYLPETRVTPFALTDEVERFSSPGEWHHATGVAPDAVTAWLLLGNPVTLSVEEWLAQWNAAYPRVPCLGGLASGRAGQEMFVYHDRRIVSSAVALAFHGGLRVETIVSQGCRPIGEPFTVTSADENIIMSLGAKPAYERLSETFEALPPHDKGRAAGNLFVGLAISEYREEWKTGDFLVRNLIGADPQSGALAIGALPRTGQTVQFQLRDRRSAHEELHRLLAQKAKAGLRPIAALVFSCTGRGRAMFGVENHDANAVREELGGIPMAGFFCNGEIGPVGEENFVHGYTAAIALLM